MTRLFMSDKDGDYLDVDAAQIIDSRPLVPFLTCPNCGYEWSKAEAVERDDCPSCGLSVTMVMSPSHVAALQEVKNHLIAYTVMLDNIEEPKATAINVVIDNLGDDIDELRRLIDGMKEDTIDGLPSTGEYDEQGGTTRRYE